MILLDLFSGIGGFSYAAHQLGWTTAAFVEKEPFCHKVLNKNFPGVPIYDDIFTFDGRPFRGTVDIITGGFPCQPFSAAGKRKGRADERHLFPQMLRVISEVRPRWVVAENVRGLLSIESGSVFAEVVASLESEGYEVITFCVPASAVEAPHRRDRLWIVVDRVGRNNPFADADDPGTRIGLRSQRQRAAVDQDGRRFERSEFSEKGCDDSDRTIERLERFVGPSIQRGSTGFSLNDSDAADTGSPGLQGSQQSGASSEGARAPRSVTERLGNGWDERWVDVAARTCVRGVDDGIPDRVHRLKSLGNSIVPQIAFEIFKAIEATDDKT